MCEGCGRGVPNYVDQKWNLEVWVGPGAGPCLVNTVITNCLTSMADISFSPPHDIILFYFVCRKSQKAAEKKEEEHKQRVSEYFGAIL